MRLLTLILCLFVFSCDDDDNPAVSTDVLPIIGTWERTLESEGYYYIDGENQYCQTVSYYNENNISGFNTSGYLRIQLTENSYSVKRYLELIDVSEEQCDAQILMTGMPISFSNGLCISDFFLTISDDDFMLQSDRFTINGEEFPAVFFYNFFPLKLRNIFFSIFTKHMIFFVFNH